MELIWNLVSKTRSVPGLRSGSCGRTRPGRFASHEQWLRPSRIAVPASLRGWRPRWRWVARFG